jgi:hypothetical protein
VCEGFLGIPANWDLWVHLFRAELHTLSIPELRVCRAMRAGGMSISLRESRGELYIPCTMTSNNSEWERGWFYLRNYEPSLPLHRQGPEGEGRPLVARPVPVFTPGPAGVSLHALKSLADTGLGVASVLANLHQRRIITLMERRLRIFEMDEAADLVALVRSRLVHDHLPPEYAATRARRTINLKAVKNSNDELWSFVMLPDGPLVSGLFLFSFILSPCAATTLTSPPP